MLTTATQNEYYNAHEPVLFMAFELSEKTWKLGFTLGHGQPPRERTMAARDTPRLLNEVAHAKVRFGLREDTPVPRGLCHHRVAPSSGDDLFAVKRLYHASSASSTLHRPGPG